ncbi:GlcG/HbpS family heme-binding protein [Amycolatopsis nalaikhensis]|uniref:Heme-binding protein n=1 Tax=Amycolatopsis nalaikhensis TaxID=715472 RepID=A0ABY8XY62_9PSEU|nr:heme-binding protein [Amycolatopsis sp. 2-2]WIV60591.1 heme-binding protein [Amycolatopsis sp. 2-2]
MISTRTRIAAAVAGLAAVGATTVGAVSASAAPTPGVIQTSHLTIASAQKAAQAALDAATKAGQHVSVAVVDRDGNTVLTLRGDGAGPQSYSSAQQKAFTAVSWNAKTSELVGRLQQAPTLKDIDGTLFLAGAVPVTAGTAPIAAVGVAGAPSGAQDEAFAQAGVDAISR